MGLFARGAVLAALVFLLAMTAISTAAAELPAATAPPAPQTCEPGLPPKCCSPEDCTGGGGCWTDVTCYKETVTTLAGDYAGGVEVSSGFTSAALAAVGDRSLYSPTDPNDGDPGGAEALPGVPQLISGGLPAAAAPELAASSAGPALTALIGNGVRFRTVETAPLTIAAQVVGFCALSGGVYSVAHTKRTAFAFWVIYCTRSASFSDTFYWYSTRTGLIFDSGTGASRPGEAKDIFVDGSLTTGGQRGHRNIEVCWSAIPRGTSSAGGCVTGIGKNV